MTKRSHSHWGDSHPAHRFLDEAVEAGVDPQAIVDIAGAGELRMDMRLRNRDRDAIDRLKAAAEMRTRLLDELEHLARCLGHDGAAKRAAAEAKLSTRELDKTVADTRAYARSKGIDTRTTAQKNQPATDKQVAYILDLLAQRRRGGDGGGFMTGPTDRAGIANMSRDEASAYIASLKETY